MLMMEKPHRSHRGETLCVSHADHTHWVVSSHASLFIPQGGGAELGM